MKRKLVCTAIAVLTILFSHSTFAAPPVQVGERVRMLYLQWFLNQYNQAPPVLLGEWVGLGKAIYPDGSTVDFNITGTVEHQDGNLLAGFFEFTLTDIPDPPTFTVDFTGHISQNKSIKLQMAAEEASFGTGVAEAEWMGNKIEGVVRDASDLSTGYFIVEPAQ